MANRFGHARAAHARVIVPFTPQTLTFISSRSFLKKFRGGAENYPFQTFGLSVSNPVIVSQIIYKMTTKCIQCGKEFEAKRSDAKFCSDACRLVHHRQKNLTINGIIIRGQHENDVPPTKSGIIAAKCWCCGKEFSRWIEAKLARLVRNEIQGPSIEDDWGTREDFAKVTGRFDGLMKVRLEEVKFCSDECQQAYRSKERDGQTPLWPEHIKKYPATPKEATEVTADKKKDDPGQNGQDDQKIPKRRGA